MPAFILHQQLENDSMLVSRYQNWQIRLVRDSRFFWLLLIPERNDITEWHELDSSEIQTLTFLITKLSKALKDIEKADKINVGALGNAVPQFHFHIVARHINDGVWPGPVWGTAGKGREDMALFEARIQKLTPTLQSL